MRGGRHGRSSFIGVWSITTLQGYMGHADLSTTMRYVHHVPEHDDAAKLAALVDGADVRLATPAYGSTAS